MDCQTHERCPASILPGDVTHCASNSDRKASSIQSKLSVCDFAVTRIGCIDKQR